MKLFLTVTLLASAFVCMNADGVEDIQQDLDNLKEELTALNEAQKPIWEKIKVSLIEANRYFATLVEAAAEEVKNGNKDLETAKEELLEQLNELSQNYTDEATPPYKAWQGAFEAAVTKVYEKISKLGRAEQDYDQFEKINIECDNEFNAMFRPVNAMVRKNFVDGSALIESLSN